MPGAVFPSDRVAGDEQLFLVEEITHRVVNEYALAIAAIGAEAAGIVDGEARAALVRAASRLHAYADAHRALQPPTSANDLDLGAYLARLCAALADASLRDCGVKLILLDERIDLAPERCWRVGLILAELIMNSFRHGFKGRGGIIVIEVRLDGGDICCQVADNGGSTPNPSPSRGRRVVAGLAQDLGGEVSWRFSGDGVTATLTFPLRLSPRGRPAASAPDGHDTSQAS